MPLTFFTQRNFAADFLRAKSIFHTEKKKKIVVFEAPIGWLEATYAVHLRLIGKLVGDFLLVIIELFSLGAFVLSQFTRLTDGQTDRQTDGQTLIGKTALHTMLCGKNEPLTTSFSCRAPRACFVLWPGQRLFRMRLVVSLIVLPPVLGGISDAHK